VLNERDKRFRFSAERRATARRFLPKIWLPLKQVAVLGCGNKLLRRAKVIGVVSFPSPSQRDGGAMMEIVVPNRIEIVAAFFARLNQFCYLPFILRDQKNFSRLGRFAGGPANRADDVLVRVIMDRVGGIEAEAIEVEFLDPVPAVGDVEFADRC